MSPRLGHVTPAPRVGQPGRSVALVGAGVAVLLTVGAVAGLLVGTCLIAYGVGELLMGQTAAQASAERPRGSSVVSEGLAERRTRERQRERITVERYARNWPMTG